MSIMERKSLPSATDDDDYEITIKKQRENLKTSLLEALRKSFNQKLQKQRLLLFGPLLNDTIFMFNNVPITTFIPYFGPAKMQKFYDVLDRAQETPKINRPIAIVQSRGSERRELCISAGLDPSTNYYTILIDFVHRYAFKYEIHWLCEKIRDRFDSKHRCGSFSLENLQVTVQWSVILFEMWVLAHIEWGLEIADEFKSNQIEARMACIVALYVYSYQRCVIDIMDKLWTTYGDLDSIDECEKYLDSYLKQIQRKIGESRRPLIVFENMTAIFQHEVWDMISGNEYYCVQLKELFFQVLRRLSGIPNWKICIADHDTRVFDIEGAIQFSELPRITVKDMKVVLTSLFNLEISDADVDLKSKLRKLHGRPAYFTMLLERLFESLQGSQCRPTTEDMLKYVIREEAEKTFKAQRDHQQQKLRHHLTKDRVFGDYSMMKFITQVYITTVLQNQDYIEIADDKLLADLVKYGVFMSNSMHGKQIFRRKDEPNTVEVIKRHVHTERTEYLDLINNEIINQSQPTVSNMFNMKGRVTEYLLAWYLIRETKGPTEMHHLFRNLVPSDFNFGTTIRHTTICLNSARVSSGSADLIAMAQAEDYKTILINHNHSIDMCFFVAYQWNHFDTSTGVAIISCKPFISGSFVDAVRKISPDYALSQREQVVLNVESLLTPTMPCEIEEAKSRAESKGSEFEESVKIKQDLWFRIIYSTEPFPPELVRLVSLFNRKNQKQAIILLELNDAWLNKEAQAYLRANEPRPILF